MNSAAGFTSKAVASLRSLWEASILLGAVAYHAKDDLLRRWLAGEWVTHWIQGRQDSNLQPPVLETGALPVELRP